MKMGNDIHPGNNLKDRVNAGDFKEIIPELQGLTFYDITINIYEKHITIKGNNNNSHIKYSNKYKYLNKGI